jgi:5-methylcytosine-specific restriction endonuclease McrA
MTDNRALDFAYPEDREFFCDLLAEGDADCFERDFWHYFDFNSPDIKRREFNRLRKKILLQLLDNHGESCRLNIHPDCSIEKSWDVDHIVPLSTNELNKKIRNLPRVGRAKVRSQSFGSNHPDNLILACTRCNAYKKHRLVALRFGRFVLIGEDLFRKHRLVTRLASGYGCISVKGSRN